MAQTQMAELIGVRGEPGLRRVERAGTAPCRNTTWATWNESPRSASWISNLPGLELAGNAYEGVGVPLCIKSGEAAAERILGHSPA